MLVSRFMDEPTKNADNPCPVCGANDNEPEARFCQVCGSKLGAPLTTPVHPPAPAEAGKVVASRFKIQSLLWTAPTYNAYSATALDAPGAPYTIIERRLAEDDSLVGLSPV